MIVFFLSTFSNSTFDNLFFNYKDKLIRKIVDKLDIVDKVLSFADFKLTKEAKKTDGQKVNRIKNIPKLDDANWAGTKQSGQCTLILTEGDSAKTMAISGLSVIGRDKYGVFPLRGKLLNVKDASTKQILDNSEITNLKKIIGLEEGRVYDETYNKRLRYGHVMILTDQDHDGSHIKGLVLNVFHSLWPSLLKQPGFILSMITPIVKVTKGKKIMSYPEKTRSNAWFLLPIFFGMIGGIIAFFILRKDDPRKARNCLYVGIVFMIMGIILNIMIASTVPGLDSGFNVNI